MTIEIMSWSNSKTLWEQARIELVTPGFAVRHASVARCYRLSYMAGTFDSDLLYEVRVKLLNTAYITIFSAYIHNLIFNLAEDN